jgi:hypothetical protein
MIQQLFAWVYEIVHGLQDTPLYEDTIYPQIGVALLGCSVLAVVVFYYVIGLMTARYNMTKHWLYALVLNCAVTMLLVPLASQSAFGGNLPFGVFTLTLIQGMYAAVLFVAFSFTLKWWSTNARRTPI